ncbi:alkyl/aryl-sulfatase [Aeromonas dhakensis]|uniref:alkyl/aryl-sulfatase n=1 Tax=Aeromonas TaxID=642 RepID=UPI00191FE3A0|nr:MULTISPECIES: alkyl sulfatase dimerization domain-containing protein [Aeromonas]MDD9307071.1 MBL fold metallo-hydrolase [Aeromonas hydrophila]MBL0601479.1 MBL fold metallo-hydrolase [Aeromonas dhakensis]MBL0617597.1 MBL fold metallo-hydrolase [Aeromonas dhakensis]QXC09326.1 MBL fold metallo-hydrolase [Aeromonas sp. FDAARGOS 1408]WPS58307.1 alkyl sulfatase dimerization domain-containing protein [Aeromonas dhakensis]
MKLKFSTHTIVTLCLCGSLLLQPAWAIINPKPASEFTIQANQNVLHTLPFNDKQDFEDARRGFIAKPDTLTIKDDKGNVVWDLEQYKTYIGLDKTAPDTVNPSLWRNAQLNMEYGLFKVTDKIYQIRGFDLSNITFIQGDKGWIVFDPLISPQTAKAALAFINQTLGERPVTAVVYSHSHVDHYGGAAGLFTSPDEVKKNGVQIIAPEGFTEHAVSENVIAGNAMARRAVYMYGALLPRNAQGGVNGGLGQTTSTGVPSLLLPTRFITKSGEEVTLDGVRMVFQMTPGTEAPAEMNTWFPDSKALWMAENTTNTMHNILTLRGAQVRDALKWSSYLNETIETWGDQAQVKFQSHHWPRWGNASIVDYFKKQRDLYKYIHDQSVRLMNMGYTGEEISEKIALPPELNDFWPNRGYYGTLRHNSRAVYQRYMGWYSGNPSDLDNLPPEMVGPKYVEFMGGEQALLKKAKASFDKGEYRWVAEVLKHLVFANPNNQEGKLLLADALEQLGYQAESGPWRSVYLQGAYELRNGVPTAGATVTASPDTIRAMSPSMLFDYLAVRINPEKAAGKKMVINMDFTDIGEQHTLSLENAVLNHTTHYAAKPDVTLTLSKQTLDDIQLGQGTLEQKIASGEIKVQGNQQTFSDFVGLLDKFNFWFNIVTP